jgi:hypothetical protein
MWNGSVENYELLENSISQFKGNKLVNLYNIDWTEGQSPWYWEALGRYLATQEVSDDSEYILYIDIDEIIDIDDFNIWKSNNFLNYQSYDLIRLPNYWYFREPIYQATCIEHSPILVNSQIAKVLPFYPGGRNVYIDRIYNKLTDNSQPFIHHYSWVRTKEEMLRKVNNWGHDKDKNWSELVEEEFLRPFNGTDFVHKYSYTIVDNKFNL